MVDHNPFLVLPGWIRNPDEVEKRRWSEETVNWGLKTVNRYDLFL